MPKVIFPGTFDPPTNGHLNILLRASRMFDEVAVVIATNASKSHLFSTEERFAMVKSLSQGLSNVTVSMWDGLIVDFARRVGAGIILRGVRGPADFEYELDLSLWNRSLNPRIETILLPTDHRYAILRSSAIKEVARLGGDVSEMVPPVVAEALRGKFGSPKTGSQSLP